MSDIELHPPASGCVPFVLPGPASARESAVGWTQWRTTRHAFVSAPRLTTGEPAFGGAARTLPPCDAVALTA